MDLAITIAVVVLIAASLIRRLSHPGLEAASVDLSGVELATADGECVRLGDLVQRPTILVLPRYYG